jgi:hypothetical protein
MAARKSTTAMLHVPMENSSDTCARRHLPAFQPVAYPTFFKSSGSRMPVLSLAESWCQ